MASKRDAEDSSEAARAEALAQSVARRAIACGGMCTGEHGVGLHKRCLLADEVGAAGEVMRALKQALDPHGVMNPGKLLPSTAVQST